MMMRSLPLLALALMGPAAAQPPPDRDAAQARVTEAMRRQDYPAPWQPKRPGRGSTRPTCGSATSNPCCIAWRVTSPGWTKARAELLRIGAGARRSKRRTAALQSM